MLMPGRAEEHGSLAVREAPFRLLAHIKQKCGCIGPTGLEQAFGWLALWCPLLFLVWTRWLNVQCELLSYVPGLETSLICFALLVAGYNI